MCFPFGALNVEKLYLHQIKCTMSYVGTLMRLVKTLICKIHCLFCPETKFWFIVFMPFEGRLAGGAEQRGGKAMFKTTIFNMFLP